MKQQIIFKQLNKIIGWRVHNNKYRPKPFYQNSIAPKSEETGNNSMGDKVIDGGDSQINEKQNELICLMPGNLNEQNTSHNHYSPQSYRTKKHSVHWAILPFKYLSLFVLRLLLMIAWVVFWCVQSRIGLVCATSCSIVLVYATYLPSFSWWPSWLHSSPELAKMDYLVCNVMLVCTGILWIIYFIYRATATKVVIQKIDSDKGE